MGALDDILASYSPPTSPSYRSGRRGISPLEDPDDESNKLLEELAGVPLPSAPRKVDPASSAFHTGAKEKSALAETWRTVTRPIKTVVGATQGVLPKLLLGGTDAYKAAREEEAQSRFQKPYSDLSLLESVEAAPGAGDVLSEYVPQGVKESVPGRILGPVARLGGNILGDPTTYLGGLGAGTKVGKAGKVLGTLERELELATKAGVAVRRAELAPEVATAAGRLRDAYLDPTRGRGEKLLDFLSSTQQSGEVARGIGQLLKGEPIGAARAALALPTSTYTGLAYTPELVEGIASGAEETSRQAQQGNTVNALASGAGTLLQTGLAALVAKGVMHERQAIQVMRQHAADAAAKAGAPVPEEPLPPQQGPRVPYESPTVREGGIPVAPDESVPLPFPERAPGVPGEAPSEGFPIPASEKLRLGKIPTLRRFPTPDSIDLGEVPRLGETTRWVTAPDGSIQQVVVPSSPERPPTIRVEPAGRGVGPLPEPAPIEVPPETPPVELGALPSNPAPEPGFPLGARPEIPTNRQPARSAEDLGAAMQEVLARRQQGVPEGEAPPQNAPLTSPEAPPAPQELAPTQEAAPEPAPALEAPAAPRPGNRPTSGQPARVTGEMMNFPDGGVPIDGLSPEQVMALQELARAGKTGAEAWKALGLDRPEAHSPRAAPSRLPDAEFNQIRDLVLEARSRGMNTQSILDLLPEQSRTKEIYDLVRSIRPERPRAVATPPAEIEGALRRSLGQEEPAAPKTEPSPSLNLRPDSTIDDIIAQVVEPAAARAREDLTARRTGRRGTDVEIPRQQAPAPEPPVSPSDEIWLRLNEARERLTGKGANEDLASAAVIKLGERATTGALDPKYMDLFTGESTPEKLDKIRGLLYQEMGFREKDSFRSTARKPTESLEVPTTEAGEGIQRQVPDVEAPSPAAEAGPAPTLQELQARLKAERGSGAKQAKKIRERVSAMESGQSDLSIPQQLAELMHMTQGAEKPFGGSEDPRVAYAKKLAAELGVDLGKDRPSLSLISERISKAMGKSTEYRSALSKEAQRRLDAVLKPGERIPTQFKTALGVDEASLQARSAQYEAAIDEGAPIEGSALRSVDLEGDGPEVTQAVAQASQGIVGPLEAIQKQLAEEFGWAGELAGVTGAGPISGVRVGDRIVLNPVEAYATAGRDPFMAARATVDTLIHEHLHQDLPHGPEFQNAYADAILKLSTKYYDMARSLEGGFRPESFDPLVPSWENRRDAYAGTSRPPRPEPGQGAAQGVPPRPVPGDLSEGAPLPGGNPGAGPGLPEGGGRPGAALPPGPTQPPTPARVIRPIAPREPNPAAGPGSGGAERGPGPPERGGPAPRGGSRVQASLTPVVAEAEATRSFREKIKPTIDRFIQTYNNVLGDDPAGRESIEQARTAIEGLSDEEISKLAKAGPAPRKKGDIAFSVENLSLPEKSKAEAAIILALRDKLLDRSKSSTFQMLDNEARKAFEIDSPEAWMKSKNSGKVPRKVADVVAYKQLISLFSDEVESRYSDLKEAQSLPPGEKQAERIRDTTDRLAQAQVAKLEALHGLANTGTFFARGLGAMRAIARPLSHDETFQGRLVGSLKRAGVKSDVADGLWELYSKEASKGVNADWDMIQDAFSKVLQPRFSDKVLEFWKAGLLGWPTQIANTASNVGFWGLRNVEEGLTSLIKSGPSAARHEMTGRFMGLRRALADLGASDGLYSLGPAVSDALLAHKPDVRRALERGTRFDEFSLGNLKGAIGGRFGEFVRTPFKLLSELDNAFKHISRMQTYGQEAVKLALTKRRDGERVSDATQRIFNEMLTVAQNKTGNPEKLAEYMPIFRRANQTMNRDTFQAPVGPIAEFGQNLSARRDVAGLIANVVVPFWKTPSNILKETLYRTPLGLYRYLRDVKTGKIPADERVGEAVKMGLGTMAMWSTLQMALDGSITGGGPTDPKQAELLKESGWQPYSFRFPGGHYYSYQRLEPLSSVLGIASDVAEGIKRGEFSNAQDAMKRLFSSVTTNLTNKTFLAGFEGAVQAVNDPFRYGPTYLKQLEASLVPNIVGSVPVGGLARAIDPNYRQTEVGLSPILGKIPGASKLLPPQRTPLGEERLRPGTWVERLFSPLVRSEEKQGPVADVARELDRIGFSPSSIPPYGVFSGQRVYYTQQEQEEMAQAERRGVEALARVIETPQYQALPDKESLATQGLKTKEDVARDVIRAYRTPVVQLNNRRALIRAKQGIYRPEPTLGAS